MLWIRFGFNVDPEPGSQTNADPDPGSQTKADQNLGTKPMRIWIQGAKPMRIRIMVSQTNADPDPGLTAKSRKLNFYMKNILKVGNRSKTYLGWYKGLFERHETRFIG